MLSLAEYQTYVNDIADLGADIDQQIDNNVDYEGPKLAAINQTKSLMPHYLNALQGLMGNALQDVAINALEHYAAQVGRELPREIITEVVKNQYTKRYYGATLNQRFVLMRLRLNRVITQTASVKTTHLGGLFSNPIPFGAQTNVSKRLLQGTTIKVEQDIAKKVAKEVDYPLIRWTLAKGHKEPCDCEVLAGMVNKNVAAYIKEHDLDLEPEGLFFVDDLPDPPHPNCQCEFDLVDGDKEIIPSESRRPLVRLRRLVRKLLKG